MRHFSYSIVVALLLLTGCSKKSTKGEALKSEDQNIAASTPDHWETDPHEDWEPTIVIEPVGIDTTALAKYFSGNSGKDKYLKSLLTTFYKQRQYKSIWAGVNKLSPHAYDLLEALENPEDHGLINQDYHTGELSNYIQTIWSEKVPVEQKAEKARELDMLLTAEFIRFAYALNNGQIDPTKTDELWHISYRKKPLNDHFLKFLDEGKVDEAIAEAEPPFSSYQNLKLALKHYKQLALSGLPAMKLDSTVHPGSSFSIAAPLVKRLKAYGDLSQNFESNPDSLNHYNTKLVAAVKRFQLRNGLEPDGILGKNTLAFINRSPNKNVEEIILNMERFRWLPHNLGENHVFVNIPEFRLRLIEEGEQTLSMRVIVGQDDHRTPILEDSVRYVVLNPYWWVPNSIAVKEILPKMKRNPSWATRNGFEVLYNDKPVNPHGVSWWKYNSYVPYRFRQKAGSNNSLGLLKFKLHNIYSVYMHDTPQHYLFDRNWRYLSHGCVRLDEPRVLANHVLESNGYTREQIDEIIASGEQEYVTPEKKYKVYMYYITAWAEQDGTAHFRGDAYKLDDKQLKALKGEKIAKL